MARCIMFVMNFRRPLVVRKVVGHSMEPSLRESQIVVASSILEPKLKKIVIAEVEGKEVIKRITEIKGKKVYLSGDNPGHDIGWVNAAAILCVVVY